VWTVTGFQDRARRAYDVLKHPGSSNRRRDMVAPACFSALPQGRVDFGVEIE
jgi:hypothetical protein